MNGQPASTACFPERCNRLFIFLKSFSVFTNVPGEL